MVIGSFLNVVILRFKNKESVIKKRSYCPFCKKKLKWYELIPVFSFIIQKGRCRKCKNKISWQYPLVEFFTGLIFILIVVYFFDFNIFSIINVCFLFLVSCFLLIIFIYDLKHYLVLDKIIYPAIIVSFFYRLWLPVPNYLLAAVIGGAFFLIIFLISRGKWMGIGDVKIGILMGLLLGLPHLFTALFLAFLIGGIISVILLFLKKKSLKSEIPFGPFLTGATFVTLLWGDVLLNWYLNLMI